MVLGSISPQRPIYIHLLGPPGAGKSTLCAALAAAPNTTTTHLSFGALLRCARADPASPLHALSDSPSRTGSLIDGAAAAGLILRAIGEELLGSGRGDDGAGRQVFLLDGFPRTAAMVEAWERLLGERAVRYVLVFRCPEAVSVARVLGRAEERAGDADEGAVRTRCRRFERQVQEVLVAVKGTARVWAVDAAREKEAVRAEVEGIVGRIVREEGRGNVQGGEMDGKMAGGAEMLVGFGLWALPVLVAFAVLGGK